MENHLHSPSNVHAIFNISHTPSSIGESLSLTPAKSHIPKLKGKKFPTTDLEVRQFTPSSPVTTIHLDYLILSTVICTPQMYARCTPQPYTRNTTGQRPLLPTMTHIQPCSKPYHWPRTHSRMPTSPTKSTCRTYVSASFSHTNLPVNHHKRNPHTVSSRTTTIPHPYPTHYA